MTEDAIAFWRGHNLGVVYQSFQLLPMLDAVENITVADGFVQQSTVRRILVRTRSGVAQAR